jgi:hypothetical protein
MMARRRELSPDISMLREIVQVLQDEPRYEAASRRIDEIEQRYVATAGADERLGLQRSAARMAFIAATDKGASFETIAARFRSRCALGFDDLFSELAVLVEFAHACADHDQRDRGLRVLGEARERLAGSGLNPRSTGARQHAHFIDLCRQRLEKGE